jgi:subtilase family serine protease
MPGAGKIGLVFLLALGLLCTVGSFRAGVNAAGSENLLMEIHHPLLYRPASSSVPGSPPYVPSDIQKGYDFLPLYAQGIEGNGTSIVIIDAYGDPKLSSDLSSFDSLTSLPSPTLNTYYPNGVPSTRDSGWALETALDVEWSHAIAPAATIDLVIAPNSSVGYIFDAISYVASNLTNATVVSMSFGQSENLYPTIGPYTISATHQLFVTMVSHGTSIFASSGDSGASTCCDASYPASDPLVVAVGGTTLNLDSSASYVGESVWGGSGAGSSVAFGKPSWQQGFGDSMRDIVDVSYDADPNTGVLVVQNGSHFTVGGTSAGSPQWAGLSALTGQAANLRFGSIASRLYDPKKQSSYHDITTGTDGYFSAGPGWDYPTGLGTPDANLFVGSFLGSSVPVQSNSLFQGLNVTTTGTLLVNNFTSTVSGTLTVNAANATSGGQVYGKSYTLTGIKIQTQTMSREASFLLNLPVSPYPLTIDLTLILLHNSTDVMVTVTREVSVSGSNIVNIVDVTFVMSYFNSIQGSPSYNPRADLAARGSVDIIDVTLADNFFNAPVFY